MSFKEMISWQKWEKTVELSLRTKKDLNKTIKIPRKMAEEYRDNLIKFTKDTTSVEHGFGNTIRAYVIKSLKLNQRLSEISLVTDDANSEFPTITISEIK